MTRLHRILRDYDTAPTALLIGLLTALRGLWLLAPMTSAPISPGLNLLAQLVSENGQGALFLALGAAQIGAALAVRYRAPVAFLLTVLYAAMTGFYGVASAWASTGVSTWFTLTLVCGWLYLRASAWDRRRRNGGCTR